MSAGGNGQVRLQGPGHPLSRLLCSSGFCVIFLGRKGPAAGTDLDTVLRVVAQDVLNQLGLRRALLSEHRMGANGRNLDPGAGYSANTTWELVYSVRRVARGQWGAMRGGGLGLTSCPTPRSLTPPHDFDHRQNGVKIA